MEYPLSVDDIHRLLSGTDIDMVNEIKIRANTDVNPEIRRYFNDKHVLAMAMMSQSRDNKALIPIQLLSIRNVIVEILCNKPNVNQIIEIIQYFRGLKDRTIWTEESKKYREHYRMWLDILTKLTNSPSRLQCSVFLEVPRQEKVLVIRLRHV